MGLLYVVPFEVNKLYFGFNLFMSFEGKSQDFTIFVESFIVMYTPFS